MVLLGGEWAVERTMEYGPTKDQTYPRGRGCDCLATLSSQNIRPWNVASDPYHSWASLKTKHHPRRQPLQPASQLFFQLVSVPQVGPVRTPEELPQVMELDQPLQQPNQKEQVSPLTAQPPQAWRYAPSIEPGAHSLPAQERADPSTSPLFPN